MSSQQTDDIQNITVTLDDFLQNGFIVQCGEHIDLTVYEQVSEPSE